MAGSEKRGVEYARADLFQNALCILTPTPATDPVALSKVTAFWKMLGMRTTHLSPLDHDRLIADISHLPHALAAALVMVQSDPALALAGNGFLDTTRIAGGDGNLWKDILHDNRQQVRQSLSRLLLELQSLDRLLDDSQASALVEYLNAAAARRDTLVQRKLRENASGLL